MLNFSCVFALLSLVMSEFPCSLTKKTIGLVEGSLELQGHEKGMSRFELNNET